jgi:uncharacterized phage-associated protein
MAFSFNSQKAIQAVAVLLKREHGRRTNYMRLLKLLYLADRQAIIKIAQPITGDYVYAMDRGPVLGNIYDLIKSEHRDSAQWDAVIQKDEYEIELIKDPGNGLLSKFEVRTLHEISEAHRRDDEWKLSNFTHTLPEWIKNEPPKGSRNPIPLEDIIDAVGRGDDKEAILQEAKYVRCMDRIFGS